MPHITAVTLAFGATPATESATAVVAMEDSAMAMVSTTLDLAQDTAQALADCLAKDSAMHLTMAALEELLLVVSHRDRGHWLLARRVAVPVERPHPVPVPVLVPAGSDVLTSLWLETRG